MNANAIWPRTRRLLRPRRLHALLGAMLLAAAAPPASAAGDAEVTCSVNASTGLVAVHVDGSGGVHLSRQSNGAILVLADDGAFVPGCATATVWNTDAIRVTSTEGHQSVELHLANGGFRPGRTDEPGSSDEIEIGIFPHRSTTEFDFDQVLVHGTVGADNIRFGQTGYMNRSPRANLNAAEQTGIDADLFLRPLLHSVAVGTYQGADKVSGAGGAGTGDRFLLPLAVLAGPGADVVIGGSAGDVLVAGAGRDTLKGAIGDDVIDTEDGVAGNDSAYGGAGSDTCDTDSGDYKTSC